MICTVRDMVEALIKQDMDAPIFISLGVGVDVPDGYSEIFVVNNQPNPINECPYGVYLIPDEHLIR